MRRAASTPGHRERERAGPRIVIPEDCEDPGEQQSETEEGKEEGTGMGTEKVGEKSKRRGLRIAIPDRLLPLDIRSPKASPSPRLTPERLHAFFPF
jgi:hypothetical protein